jgi:hypothetical protein
LKRRSWIKCCCYSARFCCAGCPASGDIVTVSNWVGSSSCKRSAQSGKPGPRDRLARASCAQSGLLGCPFAGGIGGQAACTPSPRPRMAPSGAGVTAVRSRSGARSILWLKKGVKGNITLGLRDALCPGDCQPGWLALPSSVSSDPTASGCPASRARRAAHPAGCRAHAGGCGTSVPSL